MNKIFYIDWLVLLILIIGAAAFYILGNINFEKKNNSRKRNRVDLIKPPPIKRFLRSRYFLLFSQVPTFLIFAVLIILGFFWDNKFVTVLVWDIWWVLVVFSFVFIGRFWCQVCPFVSLGDFLQKKICLKKNYPGFLRNKWIQIILFIFLTWTFSYLNLASSPFLTSLITLVIFFIPATILAVIFEKRIYCKYICPLSPLAGLYSTAAPLELRSKNKSICVDCKTKDCARSCPMSLYMGNLDRNTDCVLCANCVKSCQKDNIGFFARKFGEDFWKSKIKYLDEALIAVLLLGVAFEETAAMLKIWDNIKNYFGNSFLSSWILLLAVVILPFVLFIIAGYFSKYLAKDYSVKQILRVFGYMFIPAAISLHIAHNLAHLIGDSSFTYLVQILVLFLGYISSFFVGYKIIKNNYDNKIVAINLISPMYFLLIIVMILNIVAISLPMYARHVH